MSENVGTASPTTRGRGRGKSRGGLGKFLRARGRGRGLGRPAEFSQRLLLEGEGKPDMTEEEEEEARKELAAKYSRRKLGTNADRYKEEEPELDSDGEPIVEPEIDISSFLEKQKTVPVALLGETTVSVDEDDVDESLAHITSMNMGISSSKKGKVEQIAWDESLDALTKEKQAAEAAWDLKDRFRAKSDKLRSKSAHPPPSTGRSRRTDYQEAPALPPPADTKVKEKPEMEQLEDFLDDLLS